jgi:hypothetical protein
MNPRGPAVMAFLSGGEPLMALEIVRAAVAKPLANC